MQRLRLRPLCYLAVAASVCGCSLLFPEQQPPAHKHAHHTKPPATPPTAVATYSPDAYVLNLSQAKLTLDNPDADATAATSNLEVAMAYAAQPPEPVTPHVLVAVLDYKTAGSSVQQIAVPISDNGDYPDLRDMLTRMEQAHELLQDIHPAMISVSAAERQALLNSNQPPADLVTTQMKHLLEHPDKLSRLKEVDLELKLTHFFMLQKMRDPAYLAMENAKRSLAAAASKDKDKVDIENLTAQMEALDNQLHEELPYSL